jgi:hypothetical protein
MTPRRREVWVALAAIACLVACEGPSAPASAGPAGSAPSASSVAPTASPVTRASITMDEAHDMTKKDAVPYSIAPSTELVIELGPLPRPSADAAVPPEPNAVHVAHGPAEYYRATFSGKGPITLNAGSLDAVKGGAFPGFEARESYIIAIGAELPSPEGAMRFAPVWTTKVTVTAR